MKLCQECHERPVPPGKGNRKYCRECTELVRLRQNREALRRYYSARRLDAARISESRKCLLPLIRAIHTAKSPVTPWSESVRPECAACEWRRDGGEVCILPRCMKC